MRFADKVKTVRAKLLVSQKELAKELGVSYVTVSRWENGLINPQFLTVQKFQLYCEKKGIKFE